MIPTSTIPNVQPGRVRRASAYSSFFGHYMVAEKPRPTWISAVLKFDKDPGADLLRDQFWNRIMQIPRFRSRVLTNNNYIEFEELPMEELVKLRDNGYLWSEFEARDDADITRVAAQCQDWKVDYNAPLWRAQYCRETSDGSAYLVVTISHTVGDGISLVAGLFSVCDSPPDLSKTPAQLAKERKHTAKVKQPKGPKLGPVSKAKAFLYGVYHGLTGSFWAPDPQNSLSMPDITAAASTMRVARAEPIDMKQLKELRLKFPGTTLNDLMLAIMTGAVRSYLQEVNDPVVTNGNQLRGSFNINMRGKHETLLHNGEDTRNKWTFGSFRYDFAYKSRIELVWRVKRQVDKIKLSPSPYMAYRMGDVLLKSAPIKEVLDTVSKTSNQYTVQISNVPGPNDPIYIAGAKVEDLYFNVFTALGLYFGIVSYNGKVSATINVDGSTQTDPEKLAKYWKLEFEALQKEVAAYGDKPVPMPKYWF